MFRASELKFQSFILMSLELVYGYKASDLFLTQPRAFEMLCNPGKLAWTSGGKPRDSHLISSIKIPVQNTIFTFYCSY